MVPPSQAYYVNDTFWKPGSDAPVFVCVGGEGPPIDGSAVVSSVHCNVAVEWLQETGALMFAVEHRYYGCHNASACPYAKGDAEPMKWLSSKQALADLAGFHAAAVTDYKLTAANKWVSFGGSYPGMMAGWFRVKYPELVHASVSSSAPVVAKLDMNEYNDITASAYALTSVGGSDKCSAAIGEGHAMIGQLMNTTAGRQQLAKQFNNVRTAAQLATRVGQSQFAGFGVCYFPSQGNDPSTSAPGSNIEQICKVMTDGTQGDEVARLATMCNSQSASVAADPTKQSSLARGHGQWAAAVAKKVARAKALQVEAGGVAAGGGSGEPDYWGYQTCSEFGFYQVRWWQRGPGGRHQTPDNTRPLRGPGGRSATPY